MARVGPWICDHCGDVIDTPAAGYVLWDRRDDGPEGYRVIHQGRCDDKIYRNSMPLDSFLGPDGLTYLLSFLSLGPVKHGLGDDSSPTVRDMDAFVDFVRRVQIAGYEQAREHYRDPDVLDRYSDANEHYPYRQEVIDDLLRRARGRGPSSS